MMKVNQDKVWENIYILKIKTLKKSWRIIIYLLVIPTVAVHFLRINC